MTTNQQLIVDKLARFEKLASESDYELSAPFPHDADEMLDGISAMTALLNDDECVTLRDNVCRDLAERLLSFSRRSAVRALREGSELRILDGMVASSLDNDLLDIRDVFRGWVLLFDACDKLGFQFSPLFEKAAKNFTIARKRQLHNQFLTGPNYTKSIKAMKFTFVEDDDSPLYVDQLFSWP